MSRTISVSGVPKRFFQYLVAGLVVFFGMVFGGAGVLALLDAAGVTVVLPEGPTILGLSGVLWIGLTALWVRSARRSSGSASMWAGVPREQYTGRFAEAGGIARHNWETAVERLPDRNDTE